MGSLQNTAEIKTVTTAISMWWFEFHTAERLSSCYLKLATLLWAIGYRSTLSRACRKMKIILGVYGSCHSQQLYNSSS